MDVHRATAAEVFGVPPDQVSSEQRRYAKTINFGLIYGMGAFGLARSLGIDNTAAELHRALLPALCRRQALHGRDPLSAKARAMWRPCSAAACTCPRSIHPTARAAAAPSAQAINAPMQGTAADLIKLSMNAVQQVLDANKRGTRMIMQVHDELVFEVPEAEVDWLRPRSRADGRRGSAEGAFAGRSGRGPQLGAGALSTSTENTMLRDDLKADFDSLLPGKSTEDGATRRTALKAALGVGYAATAMPIMAQTAIKTPADGLTVGEVTIDVNGFKMPGLPRAPAGKTNLPVVLVIQEIFGVHEYIADTAAALPRPATWPLRPSCTSARATLPASMAKWPS
jgi:hypothetical protein